MISAAAFLLVVTLYAVGAQHCGNPTYQGDRVIGGTRAQRGEWPWQILLKVNDRASCGGSIINPYWIVTAAHCVVNKQFGRPMPASTFSVAVGETDRTQILTEHRVYRIHVHPEFSFRTFKSDLALLQLSSPIALNRNVKPICLPASPVRPGTLCYITGWGRTNRGSRGMTSYLQKALIR